MTLVRGPTPKKPEPVESFCGKTLAKFLLGVDGNLHTNMGANYLMVSRWKEDGGLLKLSGHGL